MKNYLRKTFLIQPKFQIMFMGFVVFSSFIVIMSIYAANLYFFWKFHQIGLNQHLEADHSFFQFIEQQKQAMNWIFLGLSAFVFVALSLAGLIFSHKIAGPIYRMREHLNRTKISKPQKLKFRKGDFFSDLADAYNKHISN